MTGDYVGVPMTQSLKIPFDNSYLKVSEKLFTRQNPTPVAKPGMVRANASLADELGIDPSWLSTKEALDVFSGNKIPEGSTPISTVYAGHQFGTWNPQLGDGRAVLLGEVIGKGGVRYDIQLKGAGPTPYSRMGDGRSPLGPVLREYIVSEGMFALGVPASRSLIAVTTGEKVVRDSLLPGAILTRVAQSHIRVGTFQFFSGQRDNETVKLLADHVISRHYPEVLDSDNPYVGLLNAVIERQALLIAKWQSLGFIHGVMNTDNMLVSGETIDYGPCAFLDEYDPSKVFSSIDQGGRYAFKNQPGIAQWNLSWLAQALLPLLAEDEDEQVKIAQAALQRFFEIYVQVYNSQMHRKLGFNQITEESGRLIGDLLDLMELQKVDFTLCFRALADQLVSELYSENPQSVSESFTLPDAFDEWVGRWKKLLAQMNSVEHAASTMYVVNPVFIPRNHLVEKAINAATWDNNLQPFHDLVERLKNPFDYDPDCSAFALPPKPEEVVLRTFCGT